MTDITRRDALQGLLAIPAGLALSPDALERARAHVADALSDQGAAPAQGAAQPAAYQPKQFTSDEWHFVRILVDDVIPRDADSGSATEAGVPEFMDFMMFDQPGRQDAMRGGLAWLDSESRRRFDRTFVAAADAERRAILDDISWPGRAPPEMSHGVAFFNRFRDLTAAGFWTSKMGIDDLGYIGNVSVRSWNGCPDEVLRRLGLPSSGD